MTVLSILGSNPWKQLTQIFFFCFLKKVKYFTAKIVYNKNDLCFRKSWNWSSDCTTQKLPSPLHHWKALVAADLTKAWKNMATVLCFTFRCQGQLEVLSLFFFFFFFVLGFQKQEHSCPYWRSCCLCTDHLVQLVNRWTNETGTGWKWKCGTEFLCRTENSR